MNIPKDHKVVIDFTGVRLVDHSFMDFIHHLKNEWAEEFSIVGLENHKSLSNHHLATRKLK